MDGLDPRRVRRLVGEGKLPAFERLRQRGSLRSLATSNPAESPVAWSSLATGCNPGRHGIFDFIHRDPAGYVPFLSLNRTEKGPRGGRKRYVCPRQAPGFWRYTSDAGIPTSVIRWPVTFPAEAVNGRFLAGLGVPDVTGRLGKHTLYSTNQDEFTLESAVPVSWRGERITTWVFGPTVGGIAGSKASRAKLTIERTAGGVALTLQSQRHELRPGQWSPWFTVRFGWGPVRLCGGIVRFHLVALDPELRLYATPVQIDPRSQSEPLTEPAAFGAELAETLGPFHTLGLPEDTNAVTDGLYDLDAFLQQCSDVSRERRAMFEHQLNHFDDGLLAFVFDAGDRIQHMFWSVDDPASPTFDRARGDKYGHVVDDLYREMDGILASSMEMAGDDTAVFVVSDHGFGPFHRAVHLNRWLIENGFMTLKGRVQGATTGVNEGRSLLSDVDWGRTQAYALGFASIYLNMSGRESCGIVSGGEEACDVGRRIKDGLRRAVDPASGAPMIRQVYAGQDIYNGLSTSNGPDLVVGFEPGYRASWQTALGGAPTDVVVDNEKLWAADHLVDPSAVPGVLATNVSVETERPAGVDLAPTILQCLAIDIPSQIEGTSWVGGAHREDPARNSDHFEESPPTAIPAPELAGVGSDTHGDIYTDGLDDEQRAELEKHLGDLGYL